MVNLKSLLSSVGLGQSDLAYIFTETLKRIDQRDILSADHRSGAAIAVFEMMSVIRDEDAMSTETFKGLQEKLSRWKAPQPKRNSG